ncbi:hypothetical protein ACP70R_022998 [Stipagrostis hirtigluma subsp. patula]
MLLESAPEYGICPAYVSAVLAMPTCTVPALLIGN